MKDLCFSLFMYIIISLCSTLYLLPFRVAPLPPIQRFPATHSIPPPPPFIRCVQFPHLLLHQMICSRVLPLVLSTVAAVADTATATGGIEYSTSHPHPPPPPITPIPFSLYLWCSEAMQTGGTSQNGISAFSKKRQMQCLDE